MGRPLRHQDADTLYLVSNECFESRCLLRPDGEVTELTHSWLRRAIERHEVRVYGTMFMRNRFVMIVQAPDLNLHDFMGYFQGNLAKGVNKVRGRKGSMFPKRYAASALLDDEATREAWVEMMAMPVEERLVDDPRRWTGVHSAGAQLDGDDDGDIALTRLPMFDDDAAQAEALGAALETHLAQVRRSRPRPSARSRRGKRRRPDNTATVSPGCRQHWRWRPEPTAPTPRPICRGNAQACSSHRATQQRIRTRYTNALAAWRCGRPARFPAGTLPPGWLRVADGDDTPHDPGRDGATAG